MNCLTFFTKGAITKTRWSEIVGVGKKSIHRQRGNIGQYRIRWPGHY